MVRYRRTYAQIDLQAIKENIRAIIKHIGKECRIVAVVKADAYGHGAIPVARAALDAGASMLAVALAEEAIELREAGISAPLLVIGRSNEAQMRLAMQLQLELCVFESEEIRQLQVIAARQGDSVAVHLKIDSGMGRIGLRETAEFAEVIQALQECPRVMLTGIFTHFACVDVGDKSFTRAQNKRFMKFVDALTHMGMRPRIHAANSAAAIDMPELCYDMVRYGISMYGYYPSEEVSRKKVLLRPAMQVRAEVSHIKDVPTGTPIGYGATFIAPFSMKIATIQIGYGDGYPRLLSNRGRMIVRGTNGASYANIVGRVCMDQTMIDITGLHDITVGDTVVVMGMLQDKQITADDIAALCGTISYEVLLGFSGRVPRVYG
jgi:alanine racemase